LTQLQAWRLEHFGSSEGTGRAADLADWDNDGVLNLLEFAFGLNPTLSDAQLLPTAQIAGGALVIQFTEPANIGGISYSAETANVLTASSWSPVPDTGTPPQHVFIAPIGGATTKFIRLRVDLSP
jgi:hypothetical protein